MAIVRISRFRYSPEKVLAFKHLSDFAQMQPVREPVAAGEANRAYHCAIAARPRRRHETLRVAPHRYATREPLGTPGGSRANNADGHPQRLWLRGAQSWAECITNMPGFNLRQAQAHFRGIIIPSSAGRSKVY
jgi:hypothetical protein